MNKINTIRNSPGRFGNHFVRGFACAFLAEKLNLKFDYGQYYPMIKELGIKFFEDGINTYDYTRPIYIDNEKIENKNNTRTYSNTIYIDDNNFDDIFYKIMSSKDIPKLNIIMFDSYYQTSKFANLLQKYFQIEEYRNPVIKNNIYKDRYNNNNDLFVHVRLDDVRTHNAGFEYYDKILSSINFDKGYIASDEITHEICKKLIEKYNLKIINLPEIPTIMFGSTCRYVVLTSGTFSFVIGILSFFSKVFYLKQFNTWCPASLYEINDWTEVTL